MYPLTSCKVNYVPKLNFINRMFDGGALNEPFVRTYIQQFASLKISMCSGVQTECAHKNRKANGNSHQSGQP